MKVRLRLRERKFSRAMMTIPQSVSVKSVNRALARNDELRYNQIMKKVFIRTCQECGFKLESAHGPEAGEPTTAAYDYKKCKKCKSEAFDRGSYQFIAETPKEQKELDDEY